jgi:SARP family transcriptional regulator, regulator of embCAB operon
VLQFKILGPLEIVYKGRVCTPLPRKVRRVLGLLLARANQVVDVDSLVAELWGASPPRTAVATAQTYIFHLRRNFEHEQPGSADHLLLTSPPGYVLRINDEQLDARLFDRLVTHGGVLVDEGRPGEGAERIREALSLWRGTPLANVPAGRLLEAHVVRLEETRIRALELRIRADIALGRQRELIPELRALVVEYPLNEWFHGQLIEALHQAGRRAEALQAYQQVRAVLDEELGLEPSPELQQLQRAVLASEPPRELGAGRLDYRRRSYTAESDGFGPSHQVSVPRSLDPRGQRTRKPTDGRCGKALMGLPSQADRCRDGREQPAGSE